MNTPRATLRESPSPATSPAAPAPSRQAGRRRVRQRFRAATVVPVAIPPEAEEVAIRLCYLPVTGSVLQARLLRHIGRLMLHCTMTPEQ
jgi:hypothetical protein